MSGFRVLKSAALDLLEIGIYLEQNASESVASRVESKLVAEFKRLASFPGLGRLRPEFTAHPYHFFTAER